MATPTKRHFIAAYANALTRAYPWAQDDEKMSKFLDSVRKTLDGAGTWHHEGDCVAEAWKEVGGKGKPTLKALRALPEAPPPLE
jgi:hypothetical protein